MISRKSICWRKQQVQRPFGRQREQMQEKGAEGDKVREAGLSQNPQKGTWTLFPPGKPREMTSREVTREI